MPAEPPLESVREISAPVGLERREEDVGQSGHDLATPVPLLNLPGHEEPGAFFGSLGTSPWDHPARAGFSNPANVILTLESVNNFPENCQF